MKLQPSVRLSGTRHLSDLNIAQKVRILKGEHRGIFGKIIACNQDAINASWLYFVKAGRVEYGPYTSKELW